MNVDKVIQDLNKSYGGNKVIIKKASELQPLRTFPFGIPALDLDLGGGALWGRTTILAGKKGSGKSSSAMALGGKANAIEIPVYWIDLEKSYDSNRAKIFGMNPELTYVVRGELVAENVFGILRDIIRAVKNQDDSRAIFVVDSLAGMVTEKQMEDASPQYSSNAKAINQSVAVWQLMLADNQILILINQLRASMSPMGDPDVLPGGMGQEFWSSAIIYTRVGETLKDGTDIYGQEMRWTIKKSRSSHPKEVGVVDFDYSLGFLKENNLVAVALELGILQQSGPWYELPDGTKIKGKDAFIEKLKSDPQFMANLHDLVYKKMPVPYWDGTLVPLTEES